jgi:hypothetical protein
VVWITKNLLNLKINAGAKAEDLEDSKSTEIYDGLEVIIGKLTTQTKQRIETYIKESEDVAKIYRDWKSHLMSTTVKGIENDERQETNEPNDDRLLNLLQKMANTPPSSMPLNFNQSNGSALNKDVDDETAVTSCCWSGVSDVFRFKPISSDKKQAKTEVIESVKSILLGHSEDVVVEVEIFEAKEGQVPTFETKISPVSKAEYGGRYHGLYSWPSNGETTPAHFYGEFSDGNRINCLVVFAAHSGVSWPFRYLQEDLMDTVPFSTWTAGFISKRSFCIL